MRPVCEADASRNPNYKFFPGIYEERYDAFLAMPIARGNSPLGVLVLHAIPERASARRILPPSRR